MATSHKVGEPVSRAAAHCLPENRSGERRIPVPPPCVRRRRAGPLPDRREQAEPVRSEPLKLSLEQGDTHFRLAFSGRNAILLRLWNHGTSLKGEGDVETLCRLVVSSAGPSGIETAGLRISAASGGRGSAEAFSADTGTLGRLLVSAAAGCA